MFSIALLLFFPQFRYFGTAANVGLNLGKREQKKAGRTLGNGLLLAIAAGVVLVSIAQIFMIPMVLLFPLVFGVGGVMYSFVGSDLASLILCALMLTKEMKLLDQMILRGQNR